MSGGVRRRLASLESKARLAGPTELDRRLERQFERDAAKRGPEWVRHVEEVRERFCQARRAAEDAGRALITDRAVRVAAEEFQAVRHEGRPVWPPEFRKIYLEDPEAQPLHDCEECGLDIPNRPGKNTYKGGQRVVVRPFYRYFDSCPACGGRVGYEAHYRAQHEARGAS